ncbi:MAG: GTP cyclohydrolase I FolE [Clostridia bacterium]|nr:GTP cyclohydrolase I FolE [Clostridia bacterium]
MEKKTPIDTKAIEGHIRGILKALGENPEREGLVDTPARVARMFEEVFKGIGYTNDEIAHMFDTTFEDDIDVRADSHDMVMVRDIECFSYCEHHLALMYNMKISVAYIPNGKIIGLSKIARIADMVCRRLQLQERIGSDIAEILKKVTESEDIAVIIKADHSCMTARGIKKPGASTLTMTLRGRFNSDKTLSDRLMSLTGAEP